ncbi:MAG TPA: hypothetical protein VLG47_00740 [Candidatus Saccharimonadales bacterium]|nr:hypothetical protein [Candidatus Saccharimonadales bacterium]
MAKPQIKKAPKKPNNPKKQVSKDSTVNFKLVVILLLLAILVVSIFLFFSNGGPASVRRIYYGYVVRNAYHKEFKNLQPAMEGLGLYENKNIKSACKIEDIATDGINVSKHLFCGLQSDNYVVITSANKQTILDAAKQLDSLSAQYGGRMYTNTGPTFSKYFTDTANGVDYNADFGSTFVRGNYLCEVHMNVAFSNPKPPAYSIQFGCNAPRVTKDDVYGLPPDYKF